MRFGKLVLLEALASLLLIHPVPVHAFSQLGSASSASKHEGRHHQQRTFLTTSSVLKASSAVKDCGCADVQYAGEPSDRAKSLDARQAIRKGAFYRVSGEPVDMDELLGEPQESGVSICVFLRSLG